MDSQLIEEGRQEIEEERRELVRERLFSNTIRGRLMEARKLSGDEKERALKQWRADLVSY